MRASCTLDVSNARCLNQRQSLICVPYSIPEREFDVRRDLRSERIFTIDPNGAKDLDDALSIKKKEDGTYEVGVHIADVSYFVKPNMALDRDARKRATSVYLVQRAVPMLPPSLSEELCSLNPHQEKLAFSAIFTITDEGHILEKWFGKTIIKYATCALYMHTSTDFLSYPGRLPSFRTPMLRMRSTDIRWLLLKSPKSTVSPVSWRISLPCRYDLMASVGSLSTEPLLQKIASKLRERRTKSGTLSLGELKLKFVLDDKSVPVDCAPEARTAANTLVEEVS